MEEKIKILEEKLEKARLGGGKERIEKQHKLGKMTARERIEYLMDPGTFVEIDEFASSRATDFGLDKKRIPGDGVVTGWGKVNGKIVYIYSQDFTVLGGSLGEMHAKKINKVQDLALKNGAPIIGINDSGGARIQEGIDSLYGYGEIFYRNSRASGVIPQISIIMGPCAGGAVYSPAITDFVFMTQNVSQMFITGPQVIKAVLNIDIDKESLGGAIAHSTKSGVAHFVGSTDAETLDLVKLLLSYVPQNNAELPDEIEGEYDLGPVMAARNIIDPNPKRAYDVKDFINTVIDEGSFFEVHKNFAPSIVVGFGRVAGQVVGIVANQPKAMAGVLNIDSSDKAARFVRFLDSFNIPILTFVDTPGFLPGVDQEHGGIIRHGAKLLYAYSESTVPKITIIMRKAYGGAYIAMASRHLGTDQVYALPTAEIAVMGAEGAANIIFRKDIKNSDNPEETRKEKIEEYKEKFANPYVAAQRGYIDKVIKPEDTRKYVAMALEMAKNKRDELPYKKHGNIPL